MKPDRERMLFRVATAFFATGLLLAGLAVSFGQSGQAWEVPQAVLHAMILTLATVALLAVAGIVIAFTAGFYPQLPNRARVFHFVTALIVLMLPFVLWLSQPEQWAVRAPSLSRLAVLAPIPTAIMAVCIYWFVAVRGLKR